MPVRFGYTLRECPDPIDASALSALNGNINLKASSINLGKIKLGTADLGVNIDRARAVVSINDLNAYQGRFGGQLVANNRNGLSVGGDLRANSIALGPLLTALAEYLKATLTLTALTLVSASFAMSDADANDDKMLSMEEMQAAYPEINEDQFTLADANGDGALTEQELKDAVEAGVLPDLGG